MTELHPLPDVNVDERTTLDQFLDYYRTVFIRKMEGITDDQARVRVGASDLDLLGLLRHMAAVEQWWFVTAFGGEKTADLFDSSADPDADFHHQLTDSLADATAMWHQQVAAARAATVGASLDAASAISVGPPDNPDRFGPRSLRWIMVHMIEEYARHCGHADMLRETADGAVGD